MSYELQENSAFVGAYKICRLKHDNMMELGAEGESVRILACTYSEVHFTRKLQSSTVAEILALMTDFCNGGNFIRFILRCIKFNEVCVIRNPSKSALSKMFESCLRRRDFTIL